MKKNFSDIISALCFAFFVIFYSFILSNHEERLNVIENKKIKVENNEKIRARFSFGTMECNIYETIK